MKQTRPICLASASPRRRDLLAQFGLEFVVYPVNVDENAQAGESPEHLVTRLANLKAEMAAHRYGDHLVLAADTVVALDDLVLGKPEGPEEAATMLTQLAGRRHRVYSAYSLWDGVTGERCGGLSETEVIFRSLPDSWITWYSRLSEPLDKAGAYAIQGVGAAMVERIEGSYTTVVGLPVESVLWELLERGWVSL